MRHKKYIVGNFKTSLYTKKILFLFPLPHMLPFQVPKVELAQCFMYCMAITINRDESIIEIIVN